MSKGEFAAHIGVSPGRLSQYIAAQIVDGSALEGAGRNAKIRVAIATEQIKLRRHIGQSLGNGIATRLPAASSSPQNSSVELPDLPFSSPPIKGDDVAHQIQQERLESERRKNRLAAQDEAVRQGKLVHADQVRSEMTKLARQVDDENAAMLADFASAIASQYQLQQRDVLHLLRQVRNDKRLAASERARARASQLAPTVDVQIEEAVA